MILESAIEVTPRLGSEVGRLRNSIKMSETQHILPSTTSYYQDEVVSDEELKEIEKSIFILKKKSQVREIMKKSFPEGVKKRNRPMAANKTELDFRRINTDYL